MMISFRSIARHFQPWMIILGLVLVTIFLKTLSTHNLKLTYNRVAKIAHLHTQEQEQAPILKSSTSKRQKVILITYGRSGSSFTSRLISSSPDVFFFFEPLKTMAVRHKMNARFNIWGDSEFTEATGLMESFLGCDLRNLTMLNSRQFLFRNNTMKFMQCMQNNTRSSWNYLGCYLDMVKECENKPIKFAKTIRFRMTWASDVLLRNPDLKILYLVRDPRAVLVSQQSHFGNFNWTLDDVDTVSSQFCSSMTEDLKTLKQVSKIYPSRVKLIRYEDGAMKPHDFTRDLYKFLNLDYTDATHKMVTDLTSSSDPNIHNPYSVVRADPVQAMQKWRWKKDATFEYFTDIDEACESLYPFLGYRAIESQKDLKSNRSLIIDANPGLDIE